MVISYILVKEKVRTSLQKTSVVTHRSRVQYVFLLCNDYHVTSHGVQHEMNLNYQINSQKIKIVLPYKIYKKIDEIT